jgi:hypothetical protein
VPYDVRPVLQTKTAAQRMDALLRNENSFIAGACMPTTPCLVLVHAAATSGASVVPSRAQACAWLLLDDVALHQCRDLHCGDRGCADAAPGQRACPPHMPVCLSKGSEHPSLPLTFDTLGKPLSGTRALAPLT